MGLVGTTFWLIKWLVLLAVTTVLVYTGVSVLRRESFHADPDTEPEPKVKIDDKAINKKITKGVQIAKAFLEELHRMPSDEELRHYVAVFGSKYDDAKMRKLLRGSSEYNHMTKMQTNVVNAEATKYMTDREIGVFVKRAYMEVFRAAMSAETEEYLKQHFVRLDLDQGKFREFLRRLRIIEDDPKANAKLRGRGVSVPSCGSPAEPALVDGNLGKREACLKRTWRDPYAEYLEKREKQNMNDWKKCNQDSLRRDARMVLIPGLEWTVPQKRPPVCIPAGKAPSCPVQPRLDQTALIGTLLDDAKNTQVGSMLPNFEHKECTGGKCDPKKCGMV